MDKYYEVVITLESRESVTLYRKYTNSIASIVSGAGKLAEDAATLTGSPIASIHIDMKEVNINGSV